MSTDPVKDDTSVETIVVQAEEGLDPGTEESAKFESVDHDSDRKVKDLSAEQLESVKDIDRKDLIEKVEDTAKEGGVSEKAKFENSEVNSESGLDIRKKDLDTEEKVGKDCDVERKDLSEAVKDISEVKDSCDVEGVKDLDIARKDLDTDSRKEVKDTEKKDCKNEGLKDAEEDLESATKAKVKEEVKGIDTSVKDQEKEGLKDLDKEEKTDKAEAKSNKMSDMEETTDSDIAVAYGETKDSDSEGQNADEVKDSDAAVDEENDQVKESTSAESSEEEKTTDGGEQAADTVVDTEESTEDTSSMEGSADEEHKADMEDDTTSEEIEPVEKEHSEGTQVNAQQIDDESENKDTRPQEIEVEQGDEDVKKATDKSINKDHTGEVEQSGRAESSHDKLKAGDDLKHQGDVAQDHDEDVQVRGDLGTEDDVKVQKRDDAPTARARGQSHNVKEHDLGSQVEVKVYDSDDDELFHADDLDDLREPKEEDFTPLFATQMSDSSYDTNSVVSLDFVDQSELTPEEQQDTAAFSRYLGAHVPAASTSQSPLKVASKSKKRESASTDKAYRSSKSPPKDILKLASKTKKRDSVSAEKDDEAAAGGSKNYVYEKSHRKSQRKKPLKQLKRRLGSLSKEHSKSESKKEKKPSTSTAQEKEPGAESGDGETVDLHGEQLIKRSVVIHKDAKGFGLTVSGESPVFVQSVKDKGAAVVAGVHQGDRIIKVNGTLVTNCHHTEVVTMIRSGSYVALTLLSRHAHPAGKSQEPSTPTAATPTPTTPGAATTTDPRTPGAGDSESNRISGPISVTSDKDLEFRSHRIGTIRLMYERMIPEYEKIKADSKKYPNEITVQKQLEEQTRVIKTLEEQLFSLTGIPTESSLMTSPSQRSPPSGLPPPGGTYSHRKTASNEGLEQIREEAARDLDPAALPPHPTASNSGPKHHRKTESMPDSMFEDAADTPSGATVRRTHSDNRKREQTAEDMDRLGTTSLPTSMYEEQGDSPSRSPTASPSPGAAREAWMSDDNNDDSSQHNTASMHEPVQESPLLPLTPAPRDIKPLKAVNPSQVNVITMEDEDLIIDNGQMEDHGPFGHLNELKNHPAHLAVFLHYLMLNSDPAPLLFYLISEHYSQGGLKEMKKWAYEIYSTFLHERAPLLVKMDDPVLQSIEFTLNNKLDKEDMMRSIFGVPRHKAANETAELLTEFRNRRSMGLGNIYGHELHDGHMSKQEEQQIAESKLWPHFEKAFDDDEVDRNRAMASALAWFLKNVGVSTSKSNGALDRCPTFNVKDKSVFKFKNKKKVLSSRGHSFALTYFITTTFCRHCKDLIWGIGNQAVQCLNCDYACHKQCVDRLKEQCQGVKKDKRKSIIEKIGITRKPSTNNPSAIREAVRSSNPPPTSIPESRSSLDPLYQSLGGGKLSSVQRSKSLQAINQQAVGGAAAKRTTFYVQHTPPRSPASPRRHRSNGEADLTEEEQMSNNQRVDQLVARYNAHGNSPEAPAITPPRAHSPSPHDAAAESEPSPVNDVTVEPDALKALNHSESSSNSSLSRLESPSTSVAEGLNQGGSVAGDSGGMTSSFSAPLQQQQYDDPDLETEPDLPPLWASISKDVIKKLKPKEKKRQDVINELIYTERAHMRNLKVMLRLFYQPMKEQVWISSTDVQLLFPNIEEVIAMHSDLNKAFKGKVAEDPVVGEVADMLLMRFDGENGDRFKKACATFCGNQSLALDVLRNKQRKDQKFAQFLQQQAAHPLCRRLELKDFIPTVMQRLVKYPLLTQSLLKYSPTNSDEYKKLQRAHECSKEILSYVNQAVKECEYRQKLADIQKRLDKKPIENSHNQQVKEYKNIDLTRKKMLHYGDLVWRGRGKNIELLVLLLEDVLVLLQKQDDRLVLRCQTMMVQTGGDKDKDKFTHSPIIKLSTLLIREVATDKKALYLISNLELGPQIYEVVAPTQEERRKWYKYIKEVTQDQKQQATTTTPRHSRATPPRHDPSPSPSPSSSSSSSVQLPSSSSSTSTLEPDTPPPVSYDAPAVRREGEVSSEEDDELGHHRIRKTSNTGSDASGGLERRRLSSESSIEHMEKLEPQVAHQSLILPTEVVVTQQVQIQKADPVLTPYERLLQHDHHIERENQEKKKLIAQLMQIPEKDYDHIAEMAQEERAPEETDPRSLILASIHTSMQLNKQIRSTLTQCARTATSEVDGGATMAAGAEETQRSAAAAAVGEVVPPLLMSGELTQKLEQRLEQIMHLMRERDAEHDRIQAELNAAQLKLLQLSHTESYYHTDSTPGEGMGDRSPNVERRTSLDSIDGPAARREITVTKASVRHQVRVEHCETIKVTSEPSISPVVATEVSSSPVAMEHMAVAEEVAKDNKSVAKDSDAMDTKSEAESEEDEEGSDQEKDSESDSNSDQTSSSEGEEEEDDDDEEEIEVLCQAAEMEETITVPDIAFLEPVESESDEDNEVKLQITEEDVKQNAPSENDDQDNDSKADGESV